MAKKSSKPRDTNSMAAAIVRQSTDDEDQGDDPYAGKDRSAVERGRSGGAGLTSEELVVLLLEAEERSHRAPGHVRLRRHLDVELEDLVAVLEAQRGDNGVRTSLDALRAKHGFD